MAIKVILQNNDDASKSWQGIFDTQAEADSWLAKQRNKPHRLPERWVAESKLKEGDLEKSLETQVDEFGRTLHKLPDEITITQEDIGDEPKWREVRHKRDQLLKECDWTQLADSPLSEAKKTEWQTYRANLRDIPQDNADPDNISWPSKPQ